MPLKRFTIIFFACLQYHITAIAFTLDPIPYRAEAHTWSTTYLCDEHNNLLIDQQDLMLIANLCYFSFMRSYRTLTAQELALQTLSSVWQGWQNIAQTRLDPSHAAPYNIPTQRKEITGDIFWKAHDEHRATGATYAHVAQAIVHNNGLSTVKASNGVTDLRARARGVMAQSLLDMRTYLSMLLKSDPTKGVMDLWKGFCFIKHLASYASQLAFTSFITAEELNNTVGDTGWQAIEAVQSVGAQTWQKIEQSRASFYLAHYEAVSTILQQLKIKAPLMFDVNGLIPEKKQTKKLPVHLLSAAPEKN